MEHLIGDFLDAGTNANLAVSTTAISLTLLLYKIFKGQPKENQKDRDKRIFMVLFLIGQLLVYYTISATRGEVKRCAYDVIVIVNA